MKVLACGFVVVDILAAGLPKLPEPGELLFAPRGVKFWIGGHPANLSVDLRQLGMGEGEVGAVLPIGRDFLGDFVEGFLTSKGVECFFQRVGGAGTGRTIVLVVEGKDRSFIGDPGANFHLSFEHVVGVVERARPRILYLACGILGGFDYKIRELFELCKGRGALTILDVVKPHGKEWSFIHPALPYVDVMHSNVDELRGITGCGDVRDGLRFLAGKGVKLPVASDGPSGLTALFKGSFITQPAFKAEVVDPTGAGDALCAGIAKKLSDALDAGKSLEELSLEEAAEVLMYGQAAGAACVEAVGTTAGVTLERVEKILREQGERVRAETTVEGA